MKRPPKPVEMTLNLAPMVDVMMCLIIFFLLASAMVDAENQKLNLAYAKAAKEIEKAELGTRVTINVRPTEADPKVVEYLFPEWAGDQLEIRTLKAAEIEPLLSNNAKKAAAIGESLRCVIRADKEVTYADVEVILSAAGLAKISEIVFIANQGEEASAGGAG
jgi:biopolymer transport protein ExbD